MFWVLIAVLAFTYVINPLLQPKPKGLKAATDDVQPPTAEKGTPIPVVFGTQKVAPNVIWWGNVHAEDIRTVTGNRTLLNPFAVNHSQVTGHRYGADIAGVLCHGPIDEVVDLIFQDTSLRKYNADNTNYVLGPGGVPVLASPFPSGFPQALPGGNAALTWQINAPDLFGGDDSNGGVKGTVEFWFGKLTQNASAVLATKVGEAVSNYKGIVHFVFYNTIFATSPYLQPFYTVVRRTPQLVSPDAATANIGGSCNGADAIYEIMTDARWGLGFAGAAFDVASFTACAVTLKAEGMGLDFTINSQDNNAESVIGEILRHIDGILFTHPETGLITLKLARADYTVGALPHMNKSNVKDVSGFKRTAWPETFNEVKVNYTVRGAAAPFLFATDTVQAQNLASVQAMGQVVASTPYDFPWFSDGQIALKAAFRTLRVISVPLASCSINANRSQHALTIGSPFVLDWEPLGIAGLVMRVASIKAGTLDSNMMSIDAVEDVFATAPAVFTAPPATGWTAPQTTPLTQLRALALPAPYYLTRADQFIGEVMVVRAGGSSTSWDGYYKNDPTVADSPMVGLLMTSGSPFTPAGTLVAAYRYTSASQDEVGFTIQDLSQDLSKLLGTDAAGLARGDCLAYIDGADGGEVIAWRDITALGSNQYLVKGVLRGQFDTAPFDHKAGDTVYFFWPELSQPYYPGQDTSTTPPTATSQTLATSGFKVWPALNGISSSLPPLPPTAKIAIPVANVPWLDPRRAVFPAPIGDLRLNTIKNQALDPTALLPDNNNLTWVSRNRLTQTTPLAHDAGGTTPESGETYEIDILHVSKTTGANIFGLIRSVVGATSPYNYTNTMFEQDIKALNGGVKVPDLDARRTGGGIRFLVRSKSTNNLKSYDMALPGFNRDQQATYPLIPSLQFLNIATLLVAAEPPFFESIQLASDTLNT